MVLNVKAAMLICLGFITGLCWLVGQVALPVVAVGQPAHGGIVATHGVPAQDVASSLASAPRPTPSANTFAHPSPFTAQADKSNAGTRRLAAASIPPAMAAVRPVTLPPLAPPPGDRPNAPTLAEVINRAAGDALAHSPADTGVLTIDASQLVAAADPAPAKQDAATRTYRVRRGDNLTRIAQRELKSRDPRLVPLLIAANPSLRKHPDKLTVGDELILPDAEAVQRVLTGERPARVVAVADSAQPLMVTRAHTEAGNDTKPTRTPEPRYYTVRKRDSLASIARRFLNDAERWREIARLNGLRDPHRIVPGRRIRLPEGAVLAKG